MRFVVRRLPLLLWLSFAAGLALFNASNLGTLLFCAAIWYLGYWTHALSYWLFGPRSRG